MVSEVITLNTGWEMTVYQTATSTSDILMSRTNRLEGDAVLAHQQTKGRGRHGRLWESNRDDGMYLSFENQIVLNQ